MQRRNSGYICRRKLKTELPGRRQRRRPKRRFMDVVREEMQRVGVREEDAKDRKKWRMIRCNNSWKKICKAKRGGE